MSKFILSAFADEIGPELELQMDVLEQHGIQYIEMRGVNGKGLVEYSLDEVRQIKKELDARGFKLSAVGSPIGKIKITDDFAPHLELFKHTIEVAKIMEAPFIRMFSFFMPADEDALQYRDEVIKRWKAFIKVAEGTGIVLLHENEKGIFGDTADRCLDLMQTLNCDFVRATFDPANFVQCDEETYPTAFHKLKDFVVYIHIKDAVSATHQVVPSGDGDGKIKEILTELYQTGFEGFVSLEPHLGNFVGFAALEPDTVGADLPEGGPRKFAVAVHALNKIINEI